MDNISQIRAQASGAPFSQMILANERQFEFCVSQALHDDAASALREDEQLIEMLRQFGAFVGEVSTKSKLIRRFQRYDADNLDELIGNSNDLAMIAHHAFIDAKHAYKNVSAISDDSFVTYLEAALEERIPGGSVEDRLMEWSIMNNVFEQVAHGVKALSDYYGFNVDNAEDLVDVVITACEAKVNDFMREHDKSSCLNLLSNAEVESFMLEVDGADAVTIDNFSDYGVAGILPSGEVLRAIAMAGLTPMQIYKELRDEMPKHIMSAWQGHLVSDVENIHNVKSANVNDFLEILEQAEGMPARPVYIFEGKLSDVMKLIDEGAGEIKNPGFTFDAEVPSAEEPGVIVLQGDVQLEVTAESIKSHVEIGRDPVKNSSLKKGEVGQIQVGKKLSSNYNSDMSL